RAASVFAPVLDPASVSVRAPLPLKGTAAALARVSAPEPDESIVPPDVVRVNWRLSETAPPVYWSVPPLRTRSAAAAPPVPSGLLTPPSARAFTLSVPALMVTGPAKL